VRADQFVLEVAMAFSALFAARAAFSRTRGSACVVAI
jgi:hypothetical protein